MNVSPNGVEDRRVKLSEWSAEELTKIEACTQFIAAYCIKTKALRKKRGSYGWKHDCENIRRVAAGSYQGHISNGAFIVAAIRAGYRVVRQTAASNNCALRMMGLEHTASWKSPNCWFNMSLNALGRKLDK